MSYGSRNDLSPWSTQGTQGTQGVSEFTRQEPYSVIQNENISHRANVGMSLIIISWLMAAGLVIYILVKYLTADPIKKLVNDTNATFNSLIVEGDTTLGDETVDDLLIHAGVNTDIIPTEDSTYSLGNGDYSWKELHTDNIYYGSGTSIVSTISGPVRVTDGFGYDMRVERIASGTERYLTLNESGYLFIVEDDQSQTGNNIVLPLATGSGTYYDFLCGTSVGISGSPAFTIQTSPDAVDTIYGSMALVVENGGPGNEDFATIFTSSFLDSSAYIITAGPSYPVSYEETGQRGILTGSEFRVTDYKDGSWLVDGTMIVASGITIGNITTPIRY